MSLAITHFAVGAACTALVLTLLPSIPFQRTLVVAGGGWAMIPDGWRFLPATSAAYAHEFHRTAWANLFWFHNVIDRADVGDSTAVGVLVLCGFLGVTLATDYRNYRTPESVQDAVPDDLFDSTE
jgi:hypothetical protein